MFRAHAPRQGACENLVGALNALKLLTNMQAGTRSCRCGAGSKSRARQGSSSRWTTEAVKIGDLERYKEVNNVVRPKFNMEMFPEALSRKVDEMTLRSGEAGRWRPPLVEQD